MGGCSREMEAALLWGHRSGRLPWGCREESAEGVRRNAVAAEGPFGLIPMCFAGPRLTQT